MSRFVVRVLVRWRFLYPLLVLRGVHIREAPEKRHDFPLIGSAVCAGAPKLMTGWAGLTSGGAD